MKQERIRRLVIGAAIAFVAVLLLASLALGGSSGYHVDWWTIDGGGGSGSVSSDGAYTVSGTIGQPDAGVLESAGGSYTLSGGFWGGAPAAYALYLPAVNNR